MEDTSIRFSLLRGRDDSRATKSYCLDQNGSIRKVSTPNFTGGMAETLCITELSEIESTINNLKPSECIATGVFDNSPCEIVTAYQLNDAGLETGLRSRTKEHMRQPDLGLALLDHDISPDMPDRLRCDSPGALMSKLQDAVPGLEYAAYSGSGSCSRGIYNTATGEPYPGGGFYIDIAIKGIDPEALRRYLLVHLWKANLGFIAFARNGAMLERSIIDLSVLSPERLIYEAEPILGEGISRHPREWVHRGGTAFSGELSLSDDEIAEYERLVASAKADPENRARAEEIAATYHERRVTKLADHRKISLDEAKALIPPQTAAERDGKDCILHPDDIIEIRGDTLSVSELLERGKDFDEVAMPDPVEGSDYGLTTAKFFFNDGLKPCIHSFAHGLNIVYRFKEHDQHPLIADPDFNIDQAHPLDPTSFPNQKVGKKNGEIRLLATIPNVDHMLRGYRIEAHYDVIGKQVIIRIPGVSGTSDNQSNVAVEYINSLATLNGISAGQVPAYVSVIADRNPVNPVANWITSKPWDGVDRLPDIYATIVVRDDFPVKLKEILMYRWLLSAVAAAVKPSGFRTRGVLVLQGRQLLGKTSWFLALIPDSLLRDSVILTGHHLDPASKDSLTTAIQHWLVEMGELDSTFRKDVARLKGFLTSDKDKVRRPYAKTNSEYQRRTVFCASVNEETFLVDPTGNSRFWSLPAVEINYQHGIDMQQVFAQLAVDLNQGVQWWLTPEEDAALEEQNDTHRYVSSLEELILPELDFEMPKDKWQYVSATELLKAIGFERPTNGQCRECGSVLRSHFGPPVKIQGIRKWKVPLREQYAPWKPGS